MTRRRAITWLSLLALGLAPPATASVTRIEGVEFAHRISTGGVDLELQGVALLRYKLVFKAYVAALYLGVGAPAEKVLEDVPRRLEIEYFWEIPARLFEEATVRGIRSNVDAETFERLAPRIERFNALYSDVEPGDRYQLSYRPGVGTELALNGAVLGRVEGADFAAALFAIWLGERPFSESLKEQLLADPARTARRSR